jgi:hypothetical protein
MGEGRGTVPRFEDTGLSRDDLEEAAEELGLDHEELDDQALLERLGVELGELTPDQVSDQAAPSDDEEDRDEEDIDDPLDPAAIAEEEQPAPGEAIEGPTRDELRDQLRERGLPVSGTKAELAERLADADAG